MFDDDNFWVKLDRDDDEIEFMNNNPTYNGSKYRKTKSSNNKITNTQIKQERVVPIVCKINDFSQFDKTRAGKTINILTCLLSILSWILFVLTVIFAIADNSINIIFIVGFASSVFTLIFICYLRATLNKEYKKHLIEQEMKKRKKNKTSQRSSE